MTYCKTEVLPFSARGLWLCLLGVMGTEYVGGKARRLRYGRKQDYQLSGGHQSDRSPTSLLLGN